MRIITTTGLLATAALALSGCISIEETGGSSISSFAGKARVQDGERVITIEEPADSRAEGGALVDTILADARARDCRVVSVDSYRTLYSRSSLGDVKGAQVVVACDSKEPIF